MAESVVDELAELLSVDVERLSPRERATHMASLEVARTRVDAAVLDRLARFDRSASWQVDAARNTTSWLREQTGTSSAIAGSRVRLAHHLREMPVTRESFGEGRITEAHARVLTRCLANPRVRDRFAEDELDLVLEAEACDADELAIKVAEWIELHDVDGAEPHAPEHDTLHASRVGDRVKIDGDLGLDSGLPFLAALNERTDQLYRRDQAVTDANPDDGLGMRTPGNRRAEALVELVLAGTGAESNPRHREALAIIHVDEETWLTAERHPETLLRTSDGAMVTTDILERLRCGSRFQAAVQDAARAVLYLGREERYANRELRRALAARDRGCAVPGCDRPPDQCDAHHVYFWDPCGTTDLDNMVLLCRHHHRMVHARSLEVMIIAGVPSFFDRYGELIEPGRRRPPPDVVAA